MHDEVLETVLVDILERSLGCAISLELHAGIKTRPDHSGIGSAYVFVCSGTTWTEQAKLTAIPVQRMCWPSAAASLSIHLLSALQCDRLRVTGKRLEEFHTPKLCLRKNTVDHKLDKVEEELGRHGS